MNSPLKLAAALALTGFCLSANAQGTKPMAKDAKMETKSEEKMETKKMEKMETAKGGKTMHHSTKMHATKMAPKSKM